MAVVIGLVSLAVVTCLAYVAFRLSRRAGWTLGILAWRATQGAGIAFLLCVVLYEKPKSFYTNFVIVPSLFSYLGGLLCVLLSIAFGIAALIRRDDGRRAATAMGTAILAAVATTIVILWRAS